MTDASLGDIKPKAGQGGGQLQRLYRAHWKELCRYVAATFGAGPPEPEDVAQAAFTKFASLDNPAAVQNPRAFLYATARNIVIDHGRKDRIRERHRQETEAEAENVGAARDDLSPERVLLAKEDVATLRKTFAAMPEKRRALFLTQRLDGLSYAELAKQTGLSPTTVKYHVAAALADCAAALAEDEDKS